MDSNKREFLLNTDGSRVLAKKICSVTNELYIVIVPHADFQRWQNGECIQDVFPELTDDQREFLLSGYTPTEWTKIFGEEE